MTQVPAGAQSETTLAASAGPTQKMAQGWPRSWAKLRSLIGILNQIAQPSRVIRAGPVKLTLAELEVHVVADDRPSTDDVLVAFVQVATGDQVRAARLLVPVAVEVHDVGGHWVWRVRQRPGEPTQSQSSQCQPQPDLPA
jgi:hypothetical protein